MRKIGGTLNFMYNWKIKKNRIVSNMPLEVNVEVTNVCNFKCAFCPQSDPNHFDRIRKTYLTPKRAKIILQQIRKLGYTRTIIHWTLDGEPFINQQFEEICAIGRELNFTNQYFSTNGFFLSKERLRSLPVDAMFTFAIDYCADKEYFERYRGTRDSWEKIKQNIIELITDETLTNIRVVIHDISSYTINEPVFLNKKKEELISMFPHAKNIKFLSKTFHNATGYLDNFTKHRHNKYYVCPYPWSSLAIASNGDVVACCRDLEHKSVFGNVFEESLEDIWNGEKIRKFRDNLINQAPYKNAACKNCDLPYDAAKFLLQNITKTLLHRLQITRSA